VFYHDVCDKKAYSSPATGKKVEMGYILMYRIAGGKFVEAWSYSDEIGMMQQLGATPSQ